MAKSKPAPKKPAEALLLADPVLTITFPGASPPSQPTSFVATGKITAGFTAHGEVINPNTLPFPTITPGRPVHAAAPGLLDDPSDWALQFDGLIPGDGQTLRVQDNTCTIEASVYPLDIAANLAKAKASSTEPIHIVTPAEGASVGTHFVARGTVDDRCLKVYGLVIGTGNNPKITYGKVTQKRKKWEAVFEGLSVGDDQILEIHAIVGNKKAIRKIDVY